jgi:predicted lipoprotein with Yx(FWY)xxD motif
MIGVLLLAQWLVAAYACPVAAAPNARAGKPTVVHSVMADCHGMTPSTIDADNPSLCKAHCSADQQAPAQAAPEDAPASSPGWFIVAAAGPLGAAAPQPGPPTVPRSGAPPGWPPIYLIHQVLRN